MAAAAAGGFLPDPTLTFQGDDLTVLTTYNTGLNDTKAAWLQNFLLGNKDINSDADWHQYLDELAKQNLEGCIAAFDTAYARYLAGEHTAKTL